MSTRCVLFRARFQQHIDRAQVGVFARQTQCGVAFVVFGIDVGTRRDELLHDVKRIVIVLQLRAFHQRCTESAENTKSMIHIGTILQQEAHGFWRSDMARVRQSRPATDICVVNLHACLEKSSGFGRVKRLFRNQQHQRCAAKRRCRQRVVRSSTRCVVRRACFDQFGISAQVGVGAREARSRAALGALGVDIGACGDELLHDVERIIVAFRLRGKHQRGGTCAIDNIRLGAVIQQETHGFGRTRIASVYQSRIEAFGGRIDIYTGFDKSRSFGRIERFSLHCRH